MPVNSDARSSSVLGGFWRRNGKTRRSSGRSCLVAKAVLVAVLAAVVVVEILVVIVVVVVAVAIRVAIDKAAL